MALEIPKEQETPLRAGTLMHAITFLTVVLIAPSYGQKLQFQLDEISAGGDYQVGMARKEGIESARGYSGGVSVRFRVHDYAAVLIGAGYGRLDIAERDPITKWDWEYWKRLYRTHVVSLLGDSAYFNGRLESLRNISAERLTAGRWVRKDSIYSVQLTPVQYLNCIPATLSLAFTSSFLENIQVDVYVGATMLVFERNLFLDEDWTKRRIADAGPDSGKVYVFHYGYRNYAPPKNGVGLGVGGGVSVRWKILAGVAVQVSGRYETYDLLRTSSFHLLPMRQRLAIGAAVAFYY